MEGTTLTLTCLETYSDAKKRTLLDTWLHILLCCTKPHIHKLHINRHNKVVQEIRKFLISNTKSRCYTLMNVGKTDGQPQENTVPHWLLPCNCNNQTQRCQCNAKLRPDILCIRNHPYNGEPPKESNPILTIQFIESHTKMTITPHLKSKKKQKNTKA
jgi:hypothetical protein